jgi:hypothetical protein
VEKKSGSRLAIANQSNEFKMICALYKLFKGLEMPDGGLLTEEAEGQGALSWGSKPCPGAVERSGTWV